jgi:hypothetical protein
MMRQGIPSSVHPFLLTYAGRNPATFHLDTKSRGTCYNTSAIGRRVMRAASYRTGCLWLSVVVFEIRYVNGPGSALQRIIPLSAGANCCDTEQGILFRSQWNDQKKGKSLNSLANRTPGSRALGFGEGPLPALLPILLILLAFSLYAHIACLTITYLRQSIMFRLHCNIAGFCCLQRKP